MTDETTANHYTAVIAEIDRQIEELHRTRATIERLAGLAPGEAIAADRAFPPEPATMPLLAADAFFGMRLGDAIHKYLDLVKRPQSAAQIRAALERGGFQHRSQNFINTVWTTLARDAERGEVVKVGKTWGLNAWYSGRPRADRKAKAKPSSGSQPEGQESDEAPSETA